MKTPEAYYAQARQMFFTAHADFQAALDELTEQDARAANMSLRELREWHAERIYAAFLRQKNLDGMIFRFNWQSRIKPSPPKPSKPISDRMPNLWE